MSRWVLAACAVTLVLSGCGHGTETGQPSSAPNPDAELSALYMRINGDPLHRSMAQFLGWKGANDSVAECMRGQGLSYQPTFVDAWVGHAPVITTEETWTAPLHWRVVGQNAQGAVPMNRLLDKLMPPPAEGSPAASDEYQRSLAQCQAASPEPSDDLPRDAMAQLTRLYAEAIGPAEAAAPPVREYDECMEGAGYDLSASEDGGFQGLLELLEARLPPQDQISVAGEEPTSAWSRYLRFEEEALDADASCRAAGHAAAMRLLEPLLVQFTDEHADELASLEQRWASVEQQAREAGWTPDPYRSGGTVQ